MDELERSSNTCQLLGGEVEILGSSVDCEHPLSQIHPHSLNLPGPNWVGSKISKTSLIICEVTMPGGLKSPRIRKHVNVNLSNGACTSWVMDRVISEVNASTKSEVEHCVEELDMLSVCPGGPSISRYPIINHSDARVDIYDNWRRNSCGIITTDNTTRCNACENLQYELQTASARKAPNGDTPKRVVIQNLSHRKQKQIIFLRNRRQSWCRKKRIAEKEMMNIDDMIAEVAADPEDGDFDGFEDNDDDE